jgi:uncharacterized protein (TIGR00296 family)
MASVEHCLYAFEVLAAELGQRSPLSLAQVIDSWAEYCQWLEQDNARETQPEEQSTSNEQPNSSQSPSSTAEATQTPMSSSTPDEAPLFVTWNITTASSPTAELRGCIGTFEALPLAVGLASYSLTAALHDTRFSPITAAELPRLECAVTLLTQFEECAGALDWEVGVHGVRISFRDRGRRLSATYLPDVAAEMGWSKEETVGHLMRKAGWDGRPERWRDVDDLAVERYQGRKRSVGWREYKGFRNWLDATAHE